LERERNEATAETVVTRAAQFAGYNLTNPTDRTAVEQWQSISHFAREQRQLPEGEPWHQPYAGEAEIARVSLELALMRADGELFNWNDHVVTEPYNPGAKDLIWEEWHVPARNVRAWEYHLQNGKSAWVVNAPALPRHTQTGEPSEPRPNGDTATQEAFNLLANDWRTHENIVGTAAPHIRLGIDTAIRMVGMSANTLQPIHLSSAAWEVHEPLITGIANIVSTDKADKRLRALLAGQDPDSPELRAL